MTDIDTLYERLSEARVAYDDAVTEACRDVDDATIEAAVARLCGEPADSYMHSTFAEWAAMLRGELEWREHGRRAAACGEDAYCVAHGCGVSKCLDLHPERQP